MRAHANLGDPAGATRLSFVLTVIFVLATVAAGAWFYVSVYPWVAGPDEPVESIDARWNKLVEWAKPPRQPAGEVDLTAALAALSQWPEASEATQPVQDDQLPQLRLADQPEAARRAVAALIDWARQRGRLKRAAHAGPDYCLDWERPLDLLRLGRLALASAADDAAAPQVEAALALASLSYRQGMLIQMMVGLTLFKEAAAWLKQRKLKPGPAFYRLRPTAEAVFGALVRDAVCFYYRMEGELSPNDPPPPNLPSIQSMFFSLHREKLWLRKHHADTFHRALPKKNDLATLAQVMAPPAKDELPKSHLVRLAATTQLPDLIRRADEGIAGFDEALVQAEANPEMRREPPPEQAPARPEADPTVDDPGPLADQTIVVPAALLEAALADVSTMARGARVVPSFKDGHADGFKIFSIRPGSFYDALRLRNGDVVQEVAGLPLTSPAEALKVYEIVRRAKLVKVGLTRRGKRLTFTYLVKE